MNTCWAGFKGMVSGTRPNWSALMMFQRLVETRCAKIPWWNLRYNLGSEALFFYRWFSWRKYQNCFLKLLSWALVYIHLFAFNRVVFLFFFSPGYGSSCSVARQAQAEDLGQHFHVRHQDHWWEIGREFWLLLQYNLDFTECICSAFIKKKANKTENPCPHFSGDRTWACGE